MWRPVPQNPARRRQAGWAEWLAQQILEAFPWNAAPTYLVRDNDRSGAASPRTRAAVSVRGPEPERQTDARRSALEPRRDRSPRWLRHGCAGMSAKSAMEALGAGSCTWRRSTRRSRTQA